MRMASSIPGELIPSASVWHAPGITPCVKTFALKIVVEIYSAISLWNARTAQFSSDRRVQRTL